MEFTNGIMEMFIVEIGLKISVMVKDSLRKIMEIYMMVIGKMMF